MGGLDIAVDIELVEDLGFLERVAGTAMLHLQVDDRELSVLLTNDAGIHPPNRDWRGKDRPTDVLSFSQMDSVDVPGAPRLLGDVVISVETARRQAEERGHELARELTVLLVHGIVHLAGYDHEEDDEAEVMEAIEREILAQLAD